MRRRAGIAALWTIALLVLTSAPALASDNGEGLVGETDDKIVTFFSLGVVVFFALFVVLMSVAQRKLERRKEEKKAAAMHHRIGW
jgi:hypothetical protein